VLTIIFKDRSPIHVISDAWIGVEPRASSCFANIMPTMHCAPVGPFGIEPLQPVAQSNYSWCLWLPHWQPVEITQCKSDGVVLAGADDQASRCILYGLQTLHLEACDTNKRAVAVVQSAVYERLDECLTYVCRQVSVPIRRNASPYPNPKP